MELGTSNISGDTSLLLPLIKQGGLILTPNRRLSRRLMADSESQLAALDKNTWQTPRIMPIDTWVNNHWQRLVAVGRVQAKQLLSKQQDLCLWEQCVAQSAISQTLLRPASAAATAQDAYQLVRSWLVDIESQRFEFGLNEDSEAWLEWYRFYINRVSKSGHIAFVDASVQVAAALKEEGLKEPQLILAGFEAPSPLQLNLVNNACDNVKRFSWQRSGAALQILPCDDKTSEITQSAQWANAILKSSPKASIAIIAQDLNTTRATVERIFTRVFKPSSISVDAAAITDNFDMSAGKPLSDTPIVAAALQALRAMVSSLDQDQWGQLLTSPFLGIEHIQRLEREALLARLIASRNKNSYLAKIRSLAQVFEKNKEKTEEKDNADESQTPQESWCELLLNVSEYQRQIARADKTLSIKDWGDRFQQALTHWGWPGSRSPSSDEYQQIKAFEEAIESFATFDVVINKQSQHKALELFERHMRSQTYHRQTSAAQVQVLGGLEGSGQTFDYLWLMGMNDRQWPSAPNPNPLLPKALQQQLEMPNASLAREFDYSRRLTQGYLAAANEIIVSYPASMDDVACKLSPLIAECVPMMPASNNWQASDSGDVKTQSIPLQTIQDDYGVACDEQTPKGGAGLLKDQAYCPFKAYTQFRLKARPLEEPYSGIDPRERGIIVHRALEVLWQELKDSSALAALSLDAKTQLIQRSSDEGMKALRKPGIALRLKDLENQRLQKLLSQWLEVEENRSPFSVSATEEKQTINIGDMSFDVRLDRVDTLADNETLVIDYKTGSVNTNDWLQQRLLEPQLPLYLQTLDSEAANGLAVASLKTGALAFKGLSSEDLNVSGINTLEKTKSENFADWDALITHWRKALLTLVVEIGEGYASVSPANVSACQYCGLQSLCRIDSAANEAAL